MLRSLGSDQCGYTKVTALSFSGRWRIKFLPAAECKLKEETLIWLFQKPQTRATIAATARRAGCVICSVKFGWLLC